MWRVVLWPGLIVDGLIVVNRRTGGCHDHHGLPRAYIRQIRSLLGTYRTLYGVRYHVRST
jgi:hypothetical protein